MINIGPIQGNPLGGGGDTQNASEVPFSPNGSISSTNVQLAIQEVRDEAGGGGGLLIVNNLSDVADAGISFGNIKQASTTSVTGVVELATDGESAANVVVQGNDSRLSDARTPSAHTVASHSDTTATGIELETLTNGSNADLLHTHAGGGTDDQIASEVPSTPAGNLSSTDVQAALNELDVEKLADVADDSTPELGGQLAVGEHDIKIDSLLSIDGKFSGITCDGVLGATLAFGDLVYLNTTDQRWELTDADAEATAGDVMIAIVLVPGNDGDTRLLLLQGFIRENNWNFTSYGKSLFIGLTAGNMVQDVSLYTTGDIVRVVGYASSFADQIYFNPGNSWIEIA